MIYTLDLNNFYKCLPNKGFHPKWRMPSIVNFEWMFLLGRYNQNDIIRFNLTKSQNWITQPIAATFTRSKFVLKVVIDTLLMNLRTPRMAQDKWRNEVISCIPFSASLIKTQNWITQPIVATFTRSKFVIKDVIHSFSMYPRIPRLTHQKARNKSLAVLCLLHD